jgi:hypothetical protein
VGLKVDAEAFEAVSATMRASGIRAVEYERDGSIRRVEWFRAGDSEPPETERTPPSSEVVRAHAPTEPARFDDSDLCDIVEETPSDRVAREVLELSRRAG